jgi:predicted RNA-binding protein
MAAYLNLFTGQTWDEFHAAGGHTSGFRTSRWGTVKRMKPGDVLIAYLTGASRFIGAFEVVSEGFKSEEPIWSRETFPARIKVKPLITLTPETAVPVKSLKDRLSWFKDDAHPIAWTGKVRGSPSRLSPEDAGVILQALAEASSNPVVRPLSAKILARVPRTYSTSNGEEQGTVTVPDEDETQQDSSQERSVRLEPSRGEVTHEEIQWMLLRLGASIGLDVWVAKNDRSKEFNGVRFGSMPKVRADLPRQFDEATNRTIELIDVLWLDGDSYVAAFEIEHTTAVYSGLLRMADLVSMQPNLNIPLYIVAPDERRTKVYREMNRATFSRMRPPLKTTCQFLPYSPLRDFIGRLGEYAMHLKPDFLDSLAEVCDLDT